MKIAPTLLIVSGLPDSHKTTAVRKMLENIHSKSFEEKLKEHSVGFHEILAARNPIKHGKRITFATEEVNKGYPSVVYSGVEHALRSTGHVLSDVLYCLKFSEFSDFQLNEHFRAILKDVHQHNLIKKSTLSSEWDECHPNGLALVNIWDIGFSKIAAYVIPCLSGLLYNSHVWMFLNLYMMLIIFIKLLTSPTINMIQNAMTNS